MLDVEEDRGGWGEWVPLIPDTPQPPSAATEAAEAAEQVSHSCLQLAFQHCWYVLLPQMISALATWSQQSQRSRLKDVASSVV